MKIVRIALEKYFFDGTSVEETIRTHTNIYDFGMRFRVNRGCKALYKYIDNDVHEIKTIELSRTTRHYISNHGGQLLKRFADGKISGVNIGFICTIFNKYVEKTMPEYDINYDFYILEARKIINQIEDTQLSLF